MLLQTAHITTAATITATMIETIKTRFGDVSVDTSKAVMFPHGLLGMPNRFHFVLTNFPNPKMQQFMLLQSLDDHNLSFITLPLATDNAIISAEDIKLACRDMQIEHSNAAILLIVSVHRALDSVRLSVNARAPLLIDAGQKVGAQYVFQHDRYKLQHML
jgi:flagellar assembly factor FliW